MSALGVVEIIGANTSFASEATRPALPGAGRRSAGSSSRRAPFRNVADSVSQLVDENVASTLSKAQAQADAVPTSTTFASLALAHELAEDRESAVEAARLALQLSAAGTSPKLSDPLAVRLALRILMRSDRIDEIIRFAEASPLSPRLKLEFAATLGSLGRLDEAWTFMNGLTDVPRECFRHRVSAHSERELYGHEEFLPVSSDFTLSKHPTLSFTALLSFPPSRACTTDRTGSGSDLSRLAAYWYIAQIVAQAHPCRAGKTSRGCPGVGTGVGQYKNTPGLRTPGGFQRGKRRNRACSHTPPPRPGQSRQAEPGGSSPGWSSPPSPAPP